MVNTPTDIEPMISFFDLLSESLPPTELIHRLLDALVDQLGLEYAAYYRGSGHMNGQIFTEDGSGSDQPTLTMEALAALADSCAASYLRLAAKTNPSSWDTKLKDAASILEVTTSDSVFVISRRAPASFEEAESTQHSALLRVLAKVVQTALRFAAVEERLVEDATTGLFNRRFFEESLPKEIERARRTENSFSVVLLDLDDFKRFNDTYGHRDGDRLLAAVGDAIKTSVRKIDLATRYGGDEFALILPGTGSENLPVLVERLAEDLDIALARANPARTVGVSIGVSTYPNDGRTPDDLVEAADRALYSQKGVKKSGLRVLPGERSTLVGAARAESATSPVAQAVPVSQEARSMPAVTPLSAPVAAQAATPVVTPAPAPTPFRRPERSPEPLEQRPAMSGGSASDSEHAPEGPSAPRRFGQRGSGESWQ